MGALVPDGPYGPLAIAPELVGDTGSSVGCAIAVGVGIGNGGDCSGRSGGGGKKLSGGGGGGGEASIGGGADEGIGGGADAGTKYRT